MMYRLSVAVGIAMAMICFATGCGSSGGEASPSPPPLTKAQFTKQADAICEAFAKKRRAAVKAFEAENSGGSGGGQKGADEALKKLIPPTLQQQAKQLETLTPPSKDSAKFGEMTEELGKAADELVEEGQAALGSSGSLSSYEANAEEFGMQACSELG